MIKERRKLLLNLYSKCSYTIEKCACIIFVRKNDTILNNANCLEFW